MFRPAAGSLLIEPDTFEEQTVEGICACGCGRLTPLAKQTRSWLGHIRGQPVRFMHGHGRRKLRTRSDSVAMFWAKVDQTTTPDGCWPGLSGLQTQEGYRLIRIDGRRMRAHRVAWILTHGPIPLPWLVVMHTCDNPPCCNPAHLELKDSHQNNEDRDCKDRQARGERHGMARLNPTKVQEIRALYQRGVRGRGYVALAKQFGLARTTVSAIVLGKTWRLGDQLA